METKDVKKGKPNSPQESRLKIEQKKIERGENSCLIFLMKVNMLMKIS